MLRQAFEKYIQLSDSEWLDAQKRFTTLRFAKEQIITREGEVEPYFYFILKGIHRLYYLTPSGEEVTLGFSFDDNFSGVYDSFVTQNQSLYYLQSLTESEVLAISHADMHYLFDAYKSFERWGRLFIQQILSGRGKREVELAVQSAQQRYDAFISRMPALLQTIPQKYVASYLGMTPETYSRMRAKR